MTIRDNTGYVGIGTIVPTTALDIRGALGTSVIASVSGNLIVMPNGGWGGNVGIGYTDPGTADLAVNGYVGIGTNTPLAQLHIKNTVNSQAGLMVDTYTSNDLFTASLSGVTKFVINNAGNVGIGTTDTTKGKLELVQTTDSNAGGIAILNSTLGGSDRLWIDASNNLRLDAGVSATSNILLNGAGTGNVGIGTINPTSGKVQVDSGATNTPAIYLTSSGTGWGSGIQFNNSATGGRDYGIYSDNSNPGILHIADVTGSADVAKFDASNGFFYAKNLYDLDNNNYWIDPAAAGTSIQTKGEIIVGDSGGGKIQVTTLDPQYTIDGTHYSTYVPSMTGVKEEVSSSVTLAYDQNRQIYDYVLDLNNQPVSSDVWLFARVVDPNINLTDVLLAPDSSAKTWYEKDAAHRTIVFYSDRPTDVSFRLTAPRFDYQNWANISDQSNPTSEALVAPTAQADTWLGIATPSSIPQFTITGPLFDGNGHESFAITDSFNNIVKITQAFSDLLVANLQVGLVDAQQITTNALNVATENITINGQNIKDYITTIVKNVLNGGNEGIVSPIASIDELHTNFISPIDSTANIGIKLDNNQLSILNTNSASGSAVATIDNQGNATFSGQLTSSSLNTLGDATISGTLHAGKILASDIEGLNVTASTVSAQYITNVTNIYSSGSAFGSNFGLITGQATPGTSSGISSQQLASGGYIDISSFSGQLAYVDNLGAANAAFSQNLTVFGQTSLSDTSIVGQLAVNGSLILADNGINVLGSDLNLQPLRQGGLSIMGGLVYIDTDGNLKVGGNAEFAKNVTVNGTLATGTISPLPGSDLNLSTGNSNLQVTNASNTAVLSVNPLGDLIASGEGTFSKLNLGLVQPALAVSPTELTASGSAGTANVSAYQTQVTIDNPNVTDKSLIYITPTSSTNNQVLYLLKQVPGESFTVGLQNPSVTPIPFNWIIVN
jgi:hypothetical protein